MKTIVITFFCILLIGISTKAQQPDRINFNDFARTANFNKSLEEVNYGKEKIKYENIKGTPYYYPNFIPAKVGGTDGSIPIRYDSFLDTVEILHGTDVYEIPKTGSFPDFTFETTNEKLVQINTYDDYSGYFIELVDGKNKLLKKIITKFHEEVPSPNTLVPGTPARFETQKLYFIKTEDKNIMIPKKPDELVAAFPADKQGSINNFIKANNIKFNKEADLIKLTDFLNKN